MTTFFPIDEAALLREGWLPDIDALNAKEIEGVSKSEQRELGSRMAVLLAHLLKWKFQPGRRCHSWEATIRAQRAGIQDALRRAPGLKHVFDDNAWLIVCWMDGVALAHAQTKLAFPPDWIWPCNQVLDNDFWPN
jgi:hypothetical protein